MLFRSLSSLFCWCVVSVVIVRDCRSMQVDLNANLLNSHSHKDLDRTVVDAAAALDVVDTEQLLRLSVIRRMHITNTDVAEVEKTEGDQQIAGKGRTGGLEEEEEEDDEEDEEEWLPVFNGGKQKLNGEEEHRDEKRVKRDEGGGSDGKDSGLQEKDAIDGRLQHQQHQQQQQQYTTLRTRNDNDDEAADEVHGEAGSDAVDHRPEEDKEERDDRSTEVAAKDSEATKEGSEEETGKDGETVKERDGEVNAEAEASIDDEEEEDEEEEDEEDGEEDEEEEEDEASSKEKTAETDGEQKRKESSDEDSSERDDLPTEDDTKKQDDVSEEADTNKQDDVSEEDDTNKQDDGLDEDDTQKKPVTSEVEEESEEMTDDPDKDDQTAKEEEEEDDDDEDEERKDSMNTRRTGSETMTQKEDEDDGGSDEHLTNSGVSKEEDKESKGEDKESKGEDKESKGEDKESKGEDKESKGEDKESKGKDKESTGSGDEKDEKVDFVSDHLDRADDTSDESQAATGKDDESAEETDVVDATALATDDDDDDKEEGAEDEDEEVEGEAKEELASTTAKEKDADEDSEKLLSLPINEDKDDNGKDESDKFADEGSGDLEVEQNIEPRTGGEHEPDNPDNAGDEDGKDGEATKEQSIRRRGNWRYYGAHGPGNWSKEFSGCESSSSRFQSPISIVPEQTHLNDTLQAINLIPKHSEKKCNSVLFNDAKTVKVIFEHMSIRVKVDDRFYKVAWVQFHWGDTKDTGSEHVIAGRRFPLEMQVVCYDEENFPDVMETEWVADNASSSKIIILATLFEISDADNPLLSSIVGNLNSIHSPGQNVSIPTVNLKGLHQNGNYFYRYSGSLTSPPCQGGVEWIVFKGHQTISLSQLAKFRQLHEEDFEDGNYTTIDYNWRPIQPLEEGRVVTRNFPIPPPNNDNKKTLKPSAVHASSSFSHRSPAIDIFYVCTCMHFVWKLFLV